MRRRAAVEPVIDHLKGRYGDRINAVLATAGYNFSLLRRWLTELLWDVLWILCRHLSQPHFA
jgi:IS5 family transposase